MEDLLGAAGRASQACLYAPPHALASAGGLCLGIGGADACLPLHLVSPTAFASRFMYPRTSARSLDVVFAKGVPEQEPLGARVSCRDTQAGGLC